MPQTTPTQLTIWQRILTAIAILSCATVVAVFGVWLILRLASRQAPVANQTYTIGILERTTVLDDIFQGFQTSMTGAGFGEGKTIHYIRYNSFGDEAMLNFYAKKFVSEKVDLIVAVGGESAIAAKQAATDSHIPIVFYSSFDPVQEGLIKHMSDSGNNLVGVVAELYIARKVELIKEIFPGIASIGIIYDGKDKLGLYAVNELANRAVEFGLLVIPEKIADSNAIKPAFDNFQKQGVRAVIRPPSASTVNLQPLLIEEAKKRKIALVGNNYKFTEQGALLSQYINYSQVGELMAGQAQRILHGQRPSQISSVFASDEIISLNSKTAALLGLVIPRDILQQVDIHY